MSRSTSRRERGRRGPVRSRASTACCGCRTMAGYRCTCTRAVFKDHYDFWHICLEFLENWKIPPIHLSLCWSKLTWPRRNSSPQGRTCSLKRGVHPVRQTSRLTNQGSWSFALSSNSWGTRFNRHLTFWRVEELNSRNQQFRHVSRTH